MFFRTSSCPAALLNHPSQQLPGRLHGQPNSSTPAAEGTMSDARSGDPREFDARDPDSEWPRVDEAFLFAQSVGCPLHDCFTVAREGWSGP
jgi:hypothetical protein